MALFGDPIAEAKFYRMRIIDGLGRCYLITPRHRRIHIDDQSPLMQYQNKYWAKHLLQSHSTRWGYPFDLPMLYHRLCYKPLQHHIPKQAMLEELSDRMMQGELLVYLVDNFIPPPPQGSRVNISAATPAPQTQAVMATPPERKTKSLPQVGRQVSVPQEKTIISSELKPRSVIDTFGDSSMDTVHYVGGVLKGAGDTITSSVEAMVDTVIDDPSIVTGVIDSVASTIMDGITYFPDVILDEIDPELSHGAKSRTNQRIDNVLDGISESISQLEEDYVKHQKAVAAGDFESAGAVVGEYMASVVLPSKKVKVLSKGPNDNLSFTGNYKKELIKLKDIEFIDLYYKKRDRSEYNQLRKDFNNSVRKEFLKELSLDEGALTQLRQHGVSESEILKLSNGKVPKGYQVHHKIPLDDGGNNDKDNLVLIRNSPEHSIFTTYQKQKTSLLEVDGEGVNIEWPIPKRSVYPEDVD